MISVWVGGIAEYCVIEQERQGGQRPVKACAVDFPIREGQNPVKIFGRHGADAAVSQNDRHVIHQKRRMERIDVSEKGDADDGGQWQRMFFRCASRLGKRPDPGAGRPAAGRLR